MGLFGIMGGIYEFIEIFKGEDKTMATKSIKSIEISSGTKCERIYPVKPKEDGSLHETVAIKFNKEQAIELAKLLLIAAGEWDQIRVTAFRSSGQVSVVTEEKDI